MGFRKEVEEWLLGISLDICMEPPHFLGVVLETSMTLLETRIREERSPTPLVIMGFL